MKKLIDLSEAAIAELKKEADKEGRSLKKHIEYLLEQRAIQLTKAQKPKQ